MSCCECTSSGNPFLAKSGWPRTSHHSQCWYWTTGTHRDAPVPAVPAQGLLCMAEEEFGMKNLLISCTGWALSSHVASRSRNGSCCPTCGSKAAAGTEVERAWFPSGAATGTAKSEGSLMRAQGGLQTHCPCPLWWWHRHNRASLAPLCWVSAPPWLCGSPAGGAEGASMFLSHPWAHQFFTTHSGCWGSPRQCHHSARGVIAGDSPEQGAPAAGIPVPAPGAWSLRPQSRHFLTPSSSTAGHDWGEKPRSAKFEPRVEAVPPADSEWPLQELVVPRHPAGTGTKRCCPRHDPGPAQHSPAKGTG